MAEQDPPQNSSNSRIAILQNTIEQLYVTRLVYEEQAALYGPLNTVVPAEVSQRWLTDVMKLREAPAVALGTVMQLARRTDDRHRDIAPELRDQAVKWLQTSDAPPHFVQLVQMGGSLDEEEQRLVFGESLPSGLRIR